MKKGGFSNYYPGDFRQVLIASQNQETAECYRTSARKIATKTPRTAQHIIMSSREAARAFIQSEIDKNQVVVFSKSYCMYCANTKRLFYSVLPDELVTVHELDVMANGYLYQQELQALTGQGTVPNVFINGQHIGGDADTQAAHRGGRLEQLLAADPR
jgi:glutaredoxin 3